MTLDPLDKLLREYAGQLLPGPPDGIDAAIHREIQRRRAQSFWSRTLTLFGWSELFGDPRLAFSALACALAIGVLPALLLKKAHAEQSLARQSLHFEVFAANSNGQLSVLLNNASETMQAIRP